MKKTLELVIMSLVNVVQKQLNVPDITNANDLTMYLLYMTLYMANSAAYKICHYIQETKCLIMLTERKYTYGLQ